MFFLKLGGGMIHCFGSNVASSPNNDLNSSFVISVLRSTGSILILTNSFARWLINSLPSHISQLNSSRPILTSPIKTIIRNPTATFVFTTTNPTKMGGNAKKRRMIAATRNAAKEKRETETKGPSTKVTEEEKVQKKTKEQEKQPEPVKVKQTWTGKSPQDLLLEHLQKNKWERTKWNGPLQKLDANGNPCFVWKLSLLHIKKDEKLLDRK